jgi:hypothetical protein
MLVQPPLKQHEHRCFFGWQFSERFLHILRAARQRPGQLPIAVTF